MKHEPIFEWDEKTGVASCILEDGENIYIGTAKCHPDDTDMKGQKTGCEIAYRRAQINILRAYRNELKTKLSALNQLYYSMNKSKNFNEKSYENKMLQRQIHIINFDLTTVKEIIVREQQNLKDYIKEKDEFYKKTRNRRKNSYNKGNNS